MPRYIDADKFISEIDKAPAYFRHNGDVMYGLEIAKVIIENALPTDVAEVKHGEWVWVVETHGDPMYGVDEDFGYQCSECHMWADEWGVDADIYEEPPTRLHFCPNCGAKMDGVRKST